MKISVDTYLKMQNDQVNRLLPLAEKGYLPLEEVWATAKNSVDNLLELNQVTIRLPKERKVLVPMTNREMDAAYDAGGAVAVFKKLREMGLIV